MANCGSVKLQENKYSGPFLNLSSTRRKNAGKKRKKCYPLSFPILGGRNSTRALQSTPFQNPGGYPERDTGGVVVVGVVAGRHFSFLI